MAGPPLDTNTHTATPRWVKVFEIQPKAVLDVAAIAGILGPIVFTIGFVAQDFLRSGYNPITQTLSELEAGPYGWVQQVNFVVFGLLTIAFAVGLHRGVRAARARVVGPAIVACSGAGLVVAGFFPLRQDAAGLIYDPTGVHRVNGEIFFMSIGVGLIVMSRRFAGDARWRGLAAYALAMGVGLVIMDPLSGLLGESAQAPLHPWYGLLQRAILAVWLACVIVLAVRLRRVATQIDSSPPTPPPA